MPTGVVVPDQGTAAVVFTKEARAAVAEALMRVRRPRLPEETIRTFLGDLTDDIHEARFAIDNTPALETVGTCGVVFMRCVTPEDADADLVRVARLN